MKKLTIETVGLGKTYQIGFFKKVTVQALQGLTLSIPENTVFGLLGPNGAGKVDHHQAAAQPDSTQQWLVSALRHAPRSGGGAA